MRFGIIDLLLAMACVALTLNGLRLFMEAGHSFDELLTRNQELTWKKDNLSWSLFRLETAEKVQASLQDCVDARSIIQGEIENLKHRYPGLGDEEFDSIVVCEVPVLRTEFVFRRKFEVYVPDNEDVFLQINFKSIFDDTQHVADGLVDRSVRLPHGRSVIEFCYDRKLNESRDTPATLQVILSGEQIAGLETTPVSFWTIGSDCSCSQPMLTNRQHIGPLARLPELIRFSRSRTSWRIEISLDRSDD